MSEGIMKATGRTGATLPSRMTDEQLIAMRGIFQAIDSHNNGSITPALLTRWYSENAVSMDIRAVEDLFDQLGAEHSLPFRRFLVYAPSFVAKLPADSKWRISDQASGAESAVAGQAPHAGQDAQHSSAASASSPSMNALRETNQALNRQIVDRQAKLDRINEDISSGEATLAAIHLKIQAAAQQLTQLDQQIAQKETQFGAYNLVQFVKPKSARSPPDSPSTGRKDETPESQTAAAPESPKKPATSNGDHDKDHPLETDTHTHKPEESEDSSESSSHHAPAEPAAQHVAAAEPHHETTNGDEHKQEPVEVHVAAPKEEHHEETAPISDSPPASEPKHEDVPKSEPTHPVEEKTQAKEPAVELEPTDEPLKTAPAVAVIESPSTSHKSRSDSASTSKTPAATEDTEEDDSLVSTKKHKKKDKTSRINLLEGVSESPRSSSKRDKDKHKEKEKEKDKDSKKEEKQKEKDRKKDKKDKEEKRLEEESKAEKKEEEKKEKEKEKRREKEKKRTSSSKDLTKQAITSRDSSGSIKLDTDVLNASATSLDPLRIPAKPRDQPSPTNSPRCDTSAAIPTATTADASLSPRTLEAELGGEKISLIDKNFFSSVDVKIQAIIDGLQPLQHLLDLSYFNLIVYLQGMNTQLMTVATKVPTVSTVPATATQTGTPRVTTKSGLLNIPSRTTSVKTALVPMSPSSPTPPITSIVRTPLLGFLCTGPYFTVPTGEMLNALAEAFVQCLNTLLIAITDSRTKTPSSLSSLCSSWKSSLYRSVCSAYHAMLNLNDGVISDPAQYFFPVSAPPAEDPTVDRPLNSVFNQIALPATFINDEYVADKVALEALVVHQQSDAQLIARHEFIRLFSVYFGQETMDSLLYTLDPWYTQSVPTKRFSEFLRLFGSVSAGSCYRNLQHITNTPGFQGYLTESVVLTLLDQQKPGIYCVWYNKVRPKFGLLNLSWYDSDREVVSTTSITVSSSLLPGHAELTFNFGFDYDGISVSAPTLTELLTSLASLKDNPVISSPYTCQYPRSSVFHGDIDAPEAEALLSKQPDGTLLFRLSSRRGTLAVSYLFRGKVGHTLLKIGFPDTYEYSGQVYGGIKEVITGHGPIFKYVFDCSTLARTETAFPQIYL